MNGKLMNLTMIIFGKLWLCYCIFWAPCINLGTVSLSLKVNFYDTIVHTGMRWVFLMWFHLITYIKLTVDKYENCLIQSKKIVKQRVNINKIFMELSQMYGCRCWCCQNVSYIILCGLLAILLLFTSASNSYKKTMGKLTAVLILELDIENWEYAVASMTVA